MRRVTPSQSPAALRGALTHFGIASLLNLLEMERRTGILELRGPGRAGFLAVRSGQVVYANIAGSRRPALETVCELLRWNDGIFTFRVSDVLTVDEIRLPTAHLLLEAARRADEVAA